MPLRVEYPFRGRLSHVRCGAPISFLIWAGFPIALVASYFLVQPRVDWLLFAFHSRTEHVANLPVTHAWLDNSTTQAVWYAFTRLSHVFFHTPDDHGMHLGANLVLIIISTSVVYAVLRSGGFESQFRALYVILVTVTAIVESYVFAWYWPSAIGYGASGIAFAFLGLAAALGFTIPKRRTLRELSSLPVFVFVFGAVCLGIPLFFYEPGSIVLSLLFVSVVVKRGLRLRSVRPTHFTLVLGNALFVTALSIVVFDSLARSDVHVVHLTGTAVGIVVGLCRPWLFDVSAKLSRMWMHTV